MKSSISRLDPKWVLLFLLLVGLSGCSYMGTMMSQAGFSLQQMAAPEQRIYKHMLNRDTFFVFGRILHARRLNPDAVAVAAVSDRFSDSEVVDVNYVGRPDSYYGLNLPDGDYELLVLSDLNRDGFYDQTEIVGGRPVSLAKSAISDQVLGGYDIDLAKPSDFSDRVIHLQVPQTVVRKESLFYPKGSLRSLDDPIFSPQMAELGLYEPAAFLETAPMMFYALEEDMGYKIPVVFVHGIGGSARDFAPLVAQLDHSKYRLWFFYYPSGIDLNQLSAIFYKIFLSGKVITLEGMPMVIVAHSMGGLVVREALNLCDGGQRENHVARLITIASPLGGHPAAQKAADAPVTIPSWRDVGPDSEFIARLYRRPLPENLKYYLIFCYGNERTIKLGDNSDGVVPLASQLTPVAQKEASLQQGFNATHTGILNNPEAIKEILHIIAEVETPFPEAHLRELVKGGYQVELDSDYSPMEAFFIRNLGCYLEALATGVVGPIHPVQEHFLRAIRGEVAPNNEMETAWAKFIHDYPERSTLPTGTSENSGRSVPY